MSASPHPAIPVKKGLQLPSNRYDALGLLTVNIGGLFLLWYEVCHILPKYYPEVKDDKDQQSARFQELCVHYAAAIFFAINIYGNMYKTIKTETSRSRYRFLSCSLLPEGWRYCSECDLNLPPRSHHCKLCDTCILKRDHHCWFTGCCIGYYNQRYYVAMVTHMVMAALYCNVFNLTFVVSVKGHLTLYNFLSYIAPHMGWLLGYYDFYVFGITLLTTIGTVLLGLLSWLLYIQIYQIVFGQTRFEAKKNVKKYNNGILYNLKEVLGKRWYLALLFPWIQSPLIGSGTHFRIKHD